MYCSANIQMDIFHVGRLNIFFERGKCPAFIESKLRFRYRLRVGVAHLHQDPPRKSGDTLHLYLNNETDKQRDTQADTRHIAKRNYLQAATV
jgi:hypothetical protein